jgi:hypothetical protein
MASEHTDELVIDGKKEITIKHSRNKILLETLYFIFWVAIGCLSIVVGIITLNQSLVFRIIFMVLGVGFVILFMVPFLSVLLNRLVLSEKEIRIRHYFKWESIAWNNLATLQLERRGNSITKSEESIRITLVEFIPNDDSDSLIYPLFRYKSKEAVEIVQVIKSYFEKNQGVALNEKIISSKKDLEEEKPAEESSKIE